MLHFIRDVPRFGDTPQEDNFYMSATSLLTDSHPCRHIVYPYTDEEKGINAVYLFASSGLSKGESVVLIMADARCEAITGRLSSGGFDLAALRATGQLECASADSILGECMRDGMLDEPLMKETIGRAIGRAREGSLNRRVRVFGEMVSLLLARNEVAAAERLEELWNEMITAHSISLLCTYTLLDSGFTTLPDSLNKLHSHNLASHPIGWDSIAESVSAND
jgi:hypothetical protein